VTRESIIEEGDEDDGFEEDDDVEASHPGKHFQYHHYH